MYMYTIVYVYVQFSVWISRGGVNGYIRGTLISSFEMVLEGINIKNLIHLGCTRVRFKWYMDQKP